MTGGRECCYALVPALMRHGQCPHMHIHWQFVHTPYLRYGQGVTHKYLSSGSFTWFLLQPWHVTSPLHAVWLQEMFRTCNPVTLIKAVAQHSMVKRMRAAMQKAHILYNSAMIITANCIVMPRAFAKCVVYSWPYLPCGASCMKVCESMRAGRDEQATDAV